ITPVEMIAFHNKDGIPHPIRLKYTDDGDTVILTIKNSMVIEEKKDTLKNRLIVYRAKAIIRNEEKTFDLLFEPMV
ncbi:MAG TPA: hypothetical protein PKH14_13825, partial [Syntrophorhabdus sp.]|nr:hypothetical protein [Syntrophorhabdus sp.]